MSSPAEGSSSRTKVETAAQGMASATRTGRLRVTAGACFTARHERAEHSMAVEIAWCCCDGYVIGYGQQVHRSSRGPWGSISASMDTGCHRADKHAALQTLAWQHVGSGAAAEAIPPKKTHSGRFALGESSPRFTSMLSAQAS